MAPADKFAQLTATVLDESLPTTRCAQSLRNLVDGTVSLLGGRVVSSVGRSAIFRIKLSGGAVSHIEEDMLQTLASQLGLRLTLEEEPVEDTPGTVEQLEVSIAGDDVPLSTALLALPMDVASGTLNELHRHAIKSVVANHVTSSVQIVLSRAEVGFLNRAEVESVKGELAAHLAADASSINLRNLHSIQQYADEMLQQMTPICPHCSGVYDLEPGRCDAMCHQDENGNGCGQYFCSVCMYKSDVDAHQHCDEVHGSVWLRKDHPEEFNRFQRLWKLNRLREYIRNLDSEVVPELMETIEWRQILQKDLNTAPSWDFTNNNDLLQGYLGLSEAATALDLPRGADGLQRWTNAIDALPDLTKRRVSAQVCVEMAIQNLHDWYTISYKNPGHLDLSHCYTTDAELVAALAVLLGQPADLRLQVQSVNLSSNPQLTRVPDCFARLANLKQLQTDAHVQIPDNVVEMLFRDLRRQVLARKSSQQPRHVRVNCHLEGAFSTSNLQRVLLLLAEFSIGERVVVLAPPDGSREFASIVASQPETATCDIRTDSGEDKRVSNTELEKFDLEELSLSCTVPIELELPSQDQFDWSTLPSLKAIHVSGAQLHIPRSA